MPSDFARNFMNHVYESIMHGDDGHRKWLKTKCTALIPALDKRLTKLKSDLSTQTIIKTRPSDDTVIARLIDTTEYRNAVSEPFKNPAFGTPAYNWKDKPHRLVYDLCGEIERLNEEIKQMRERYKLDIRNGANKNV